MFILKDQRFLEWELNIQTVFFQGFFFLSRQKHLLVAKKTTLDLQDSQGGFHETAPPLQQLTPSSVDCINK